MSDSTKLSFSSGDGKKSVWLYRLADGTIHLSEVRDTAEPNSGDAPAGCNLTISASGLDRLVFALLTDRFKGQSGIIEELRALLIADEIPYSLETYS